MPLQLCDARCQGNVAGLTAHQVLAVIPRVLARWGRATDWQSGADA